MLRIFLNATSRLLIFLSFACCLHAQSPDARKFEVGAGYALMRTNFLDGFDKAKSGIAGRLGYNVSDHLGIEGELNIFPQDLEVFSKGMVAGFFGAKAGWRSEKIGVFGKIRPGFVRFQQLNAALICPAVFPPVFACALANKTDFALDAGGVLEFYLRSGMGFRVDVSDLMIRFPGPYSNAPQGSTPPRFWRQNFAMGASVVFRF